MNECTRHKGRLYDLCTGVGHDGRPNPTQEVCNRFRAKYGNELITVEKSNPIDLAHGNVPSKTVSTIGTRLMRIFEARVAAIPCSDCKTAIKRLNTMTPDEVEADRENIVNRIFENSQNAGAAWWAKATMVVDKMVNGGDGMRFVIGRWLDESVKADREATQCE